MQNQPEKDSAPFIVLPPIVRIEPGKGQSWRLVFNGSRLPQDRESLFWFNLLDIPPEPKNGTAINYLQLAIRSRIKLFYRPAGVAAEKMAPENAPALGADSHGQWAAGEQCLIALYHHRQHHP